MRSAGKLLTKWSCYVTPSNGTRLGRDVIKSVCFRIHHTFTPARVVKTEPPFEVTRTGWGTFVIDITIVATHGTIYYP